MKKHSVTMLNILISGLLVSFMAVAVTGCSGNGTGRDKKHNRHTDRDDNVAEIRRNASPDVIGDDICDGYFAPTIETDEFLEIYGLAGGNWASEDGLNTMHFYQADDGLYYIEIDCVKENGLRCGFPEYNLFEIRYSDSYRYFDHELKSDEVIIDIFCNDGLMQYHDRFVMQTEGEYIVYQDCSSDGYEFVMYPA